MRTLEYTNFIGMSSIGKIPGLIFRNFPEPIDNTAGLKRVCRDGSGVITTIRKKGLNPATCCFTVFRRDDTQYLAVMPIVISPEVASECIEQMITLTAFSDRWDCLEWKKVDGRADESKEVKEEDHGPTNTYILRSLSQLFRLPTKSGRVIEVYGTLYLETEDILDDFLDAGYPQGEEEVILDDIGKIYSFEGKT